MITTHDIKLENWSAISEQLSDRRLAVWIALSHLGECTSRRLANYMGADVVAIRPRLTELTQLGFAVLMGKQGHEGTYRACSMEEAHRNYLVQQTNIQNPQLEMPLP